MGSDCQHRRIVSSPVDVCRRGTILGAMRNGLTLLNVQAFYQLLATGIIIILAMLVDRLARGKG
jgi:ribose/xylose/arabinose/galactoside ABC-type transport system permease subunit